MKESNDGSYSLQSFTEMNGIKLKLMCFCTTDPNRKYLPRCALYNVRMYDVHVLVRSGQQTNIFNSIWRNVR